MNRLTFFPIAADGAFDGITGIKKQLVSHPEASEALEIISELGYSAEQFGQECYAAVYASFVIGRFFDGRRYIFTFPIPFSDSASEDGCSSALRLLAEYSVRELIPLYISDVPRENLELLCELFPEIDAACYDEDEDLFSALVLNECLSLEKIPRISEGDLTLREIDECDAEKYYDLCTDGDVSGFWGYNAALDMPSADGKALLSEARSEFERGVALSLGIYKSGEFVGEAVIFGFDYFGGAQIAIRLLPPAQGRGVGSAALGLLIKLARQIGLKEISTKVMAENFGSLKMTGKYMERVGEADGTVKFRLSLI